MREAKAVIGEAARLSEEFRPLEEEYLAKVRNGELSEERRHAYATKSLRADIDAYTAKIAAIKEALS
jgi:hypothetical protein